VTDSELAARADHAGSIFIGRPSVRSCNHPGGRFHALIEYALLNLDLVKESVDAATAAMLAAGKGKPKSG
jgi:hypothetical protein